LGQQRDRRGRLIVIDLPQVVDVIANPRGVAFLDRDATNVARWFAGHGLVGVTPAPDDLPGLLRHEAGIG
jgi:RIO kinase 1